MNGALYAVSPAATIGTAIASSPLATALRESVWLYPTVETLHILGLALLFGSIVVVDLRLLGVRRNVQLGPLIRFVLPVTLLSALLVVPTGLLLFAAHANDLIGNRAFIVKMLLLFAVAINALMFHAGPYRQEIEATPGQATRGSTRLFAAVSIVLWIAVVVAGRSIAYV